MDSFQKSIIIIASIVLLVSLIILAYSIHRTIKNISFPPTITDCPDYWDVTLDSDNNIQCVNNSGINEGLGTSKCTNIQTSQFNSNGTDPHNVLCQKYNWTKDCKIVWDGVSNNSNPCNKASLWNNNYETLYGSLY